MTPEVPRARRILDRPGRVAAIGGAAVVCLLSISGAVGLSHTGLGSGGTQQPGAAAGAGSAGSSGSDASGGSAGSTGGSGSGTTGDSQGSGRGGDTGTAVKGSKPDSKSSDSTIAEAKSTQPSTQSAALPAHSGTGKRVVFDQSAQRVWLVNADNSVARTYLVSGSKYNNLSTGTYQVYSRDRYATAYNSDETMNYMVRFATGRTSPIGFHSIPAMPDGTMVETRAELGVPASDGCIRQWIGDARALWNFTPDGTTVIVRA